MTRSTFVRGELVEVRWLGSWVLASYVEERPPRAPGDPVSHVVRVRGERLGISLPEVGVRKASEATVAAALLALARDLLVRERAPFPALAAARRLGVDLRSGAWTLAIRARAAAGGDREAAGGDRDEAQLLRAVSLLESGLVS